MYNAIAIYTVNSQDAEKILKRAEQLARLSWNLYGFQRLDSGYETITTDGFGNPYGHERKLKVFGIAIKLPEYMDHRTALAYLDYGARFAECSAEYYLTNI